MRLAMAEAPVGDDVFGEDPTIRRLEAISAERTGKEAAIFVASGDASSVVEQPGLAVDELLVRSEHAAERAGREDHQVEPEQTADQHPDGLRRGIHSARAWHSEGQTHVHVRGYWVARGEGLYASPDHLPLMQIAYTPVYYALIGLLIRLFGDSGYTLGRAVSLVAMLLGALALAWTVRRITRSWRFGLLAAGLLLTQNATVLLWGSLERVDALALALTLVGLALFTDQRVVPAALVFVLAFFTKQTYFIAPLAGAIALWPCRRDFLRLSAVFVGGVVVGMAVAEWRTSGWFWWHIVTSNANQPDLETFSILIGSFLQFNGLTTLAALASLLLPCGRGERVWRLYFVGSLLELLTVAKLGASSNYWLEASAATAVLLAIAAHRLSREPATRLIGPVVLSGALLIAVPAYQATATELGEVGFDLLRPSTPSYLSLVADVGADPYRVDVRLIEEIAHEPGALLTDNSGLAVAAGKRIEYEFQIFQLLRVEGIWSERPILDAIAERRFSLVALMHPLDGPSAGTRWSPEIQSALQANYAATGAEYGFWLYRPRPGE